MEDKFLRLNRRAAQQSMQHHSQQHHNMNRNPPEMRRRIHVPKFLVVADPFEQIVGVHVLFAGRGLSSQLGSVYPYHPNSAPVAKGPSL
jgi:hypothetical protein